MMRGLFFGLFTLSAVALCGGGFLISSVSASTTLYLGPIEKTYDENGAVVEEKVYYPAGNSVAAKSTDYNLETRTYNLSYLFPDHLGSTVLVTDEDGKVRQGYVYYPYGSQVNYESGIRNHGIDKLYTGQRLDGSTSLYFYNARYYNPTIGHFISADRAQGPNRYAYVGNNPVGRNDPSGNVACWTQEQCDRMFPGRKEARENFPEDPQSPQNVGQWIASGFAHLANLSGFGSLLPQNLKQYVSSQEAEQAVGAGSLPGPAVVNIVDVRQLAKQAAGKGLGDMTVVPLSREPRYVEGFMSRVYAWLRNPGIEPNLLIHPESKLPYAPPVQGYSHFKELFTAARGEREMGRTYTGVWAVTTDKLLRVSAQDPSLVKHGMLTGGTPVKMAGEFNFRWFRDAEGIKRFQIFNVNLSSGGFKPREYAEKLQYAITLLKTMLSP